LGRLAGFPVEPQGFGELLPHIWVPPPGPRSRANAAALALFESPAISTIANGDVPLFWIAAAGANVLDADGNVYIDTTSAFGVASVGHRNPRVVAAAEAQARRLVHAMGDFQPPVVRLELARALRKVLPAGLDRVLFGLTGADAVELSLKCAGVFTGRPGVIAFEGAFHGQSYGSLAVTSRRTFSDRFLRQLGNHVRRAPYPYPYRRPKGLSEAADVDRCLSAVRAQTRQMSLDGIRPGCVIVEPCQGREGEIIPPPAFLPGLRRLCDDLELVLIADEIYTGFGRTGRMWACDHTGVVPDLLCAGKALGGGYPGSIVAGRADIMDAWRPNTPEAPHSSTFLGHPVGCAAALAVLAELSERGLVQRSRETGATLLAALKAATESNPHVGEVRGLGMMIGIEVVRDRESRDPMPEAVPAILQAGLDCGLIMLPGGMYGNVISLSPPFVTTDEQFQYVTEKLPHCLTV
jgi:4-aminobutyrate aminotransferase / (S)-3-amino-2-methylpropionate transaminase / 5-aminovalerate transaminase